MQCPLAFLCKCSQLTSFTLMAAGSRRYSPATVQDTRIRKIQINGYILRDLALSCVFNLYALKQPDGVFRQSLNIEGLTCSLQQRETWWLDWASDGASPTILILRVPWPLRHRPHCLRQHAEVCWCFFMLMVFSCVVVVWFLTIKFSKLLCRLVSLMGLCCLMQPKRLLLNNFFPSIVFRLF